MTSVVAALRVIGRRLAAFVRAQPVSVVIAALVTVLAIVSGSLARGPADWLTDLVGAGIDGHATLTAWLFTLASVLFAGSLPSLLLTVVAVLVLVGASERRIGHRRALIAYLVTGIVATLVGAGVQALGLALDNGWAKAVAYDTTLHPFTPALGTIMTASAFAGSLWRRRIRLFGFAGITTFLLYDGHPSGLYALVGAVAGLALGRLLRRGAPRPGRWNRSTHHEARVLLSTLVAISALGPLVTIVTRAPIGVLAPLGVLFADRLPNDHLSRFCAAALHHVAQDPTGHGAVCARDYAVGGLHGPGTVLLSILPLVTLLLAALLIRRGRRLAVWIAALVNFVLAVLAAAAFAVLPVHVTTAVAAPGERAEHLFVIAIGAAAPLAVGVVLVVFLRHFTVPTPRPLVVRFVLVLVGTFLVLAIGYVVAGTFFEDSFSPRIDLPGLLVSAPERFVPVGFLGLRNLGPVPVDGPLRVVFHTIGPVFWLVLIVGMLVVASRGSRVGASVQSRSAVTRILHRGVEGTLAHMATWEGNSYWVSDDGEAAVAYRVVGSTALTTGDPLCLPDRVESTVLDFARWCDDRGLTPVFYSVRDDLSPLFHRLGWSTLPVAEETVLHPATFQMQGKKWQDVRSSINRAAKSGVRAEWTRYVDLRPVVARQIENISEQWVAEKGLPEMGFTLGGLDELMDRDVALMLALDEEDRVFAVTSWLPSYRDGEVIGWTLDFMRRLPDGMNGVMEFLIASAALRAKEEGIEFLSLSAAPLATPPAPADAEPSPDSTTERFMAFLARTLEPAYGFQSLLTFKLKFQPEFVPLVMAFPDPLQLPAIGTALGRAYLPDLSVRQIPRLIRSVSG
ncbi:bifunctional lysylphosphatidylglycerol flippase/synthetase MprF [Frondihabitans cladoniiphilus]|uniref:DUF2156 domain-containing protein n=1 Tax=Frondihabitans cladoniiphilus TaxID=715785 RepID=A0ABP8VLF7_9MICO